MAIFLKFLVDALALIFNKFVIKFFLFAALYFAVFEFTPYLIRLIGGYDLIIGVKGFYNSLPSSVHYFLSLAAVGTGLKIVLSAYIVRFIIRRIPVIG